MENNKTFTQVMDAPEVKEDVLVGKGVGFMRIRRITGYLVGTIDQFNNAKRAEVNDRVKHGVSRKAERI